MPQKDAPTSPRADERVIDSNGRFTKNAYSTLQQIWRQVAAGHVVIPVEITNVGNKYTLVPKLHQEGAESYGDHMVFCGPASAASTGSVTAEVKSASHHKTLPTIKVYKNNGLAQAGSGDVADGAFYLWIYVEALDGGAGGFVLK